jgi:hypothetical protein
MELPRALPVGLHYIASASFGEELFKEFWKYQCALTREFGKSMTNV